MNIKEEIRKNIANDFSGHPGLTQRARDIANQVFSSSDYSLESPDNIGFVDTVILKDNFGICRHVPILPSDLLSSYNRLALEICQRIKSEVLKVDELCSYDSRFSKTGLLCKPDYKNRKPWSSFISNPRGLINKKGYYGIGIDIKNFYPSIKCEYLDSIDSLLDISNPDSVWLHSQLSELLHRISKLSGQPGLPLGYKPTRFFAKLYLMPLIARLVNHGFHVFVWVDDIRILASNPQQLIHAKKIVQDFCDEFCLRINKEKQFAIKPGSQTQPLDGIQRFDSLRDHNECEFELTDTSFFAKQDTNYSTYDGDCLLPVEFDSIKQIKIQQDNSLKQTRRSTQTLYAKNILNNGHYVIDFHRQLFKLFPTASPDLIRMLGPYFSCDYIVEMILSSTSNSAMENECLVAHINWSDRDTKSKSIRDQFLVEMANRLSGGSEFLNLTYVAYLCRYGCRALREVSLETVLERREPVFGLQFISNNESLSKRDRQRIRDRFPDNQFILAALESV